jgi:peroxiredoxin (alkyl hydroperoxide reductase subunit C)
MTAFQQNLEKLEAAGAQVLGVSMDSPYANKAWADSLELTFPLLSDWGGTVTRLYGVFDEAENAPRRTTFVIDESGKVIAKQEGKEAVDPTAAIEACTIGSGE